MELVGGVFYLGMFGVYGVGFFQFGNDYGDVGFGNVWLYFDVMSGVYEGGKILGCGSVGDIFLQV